MINRIQIWLNKEGDTDRLRLPVNPSEVTISTGVSHEDKRVVQFGEITVLGQKNQFDLSLESFFPKHYSPICEYVDIPDPYASLNKLIAWSESGVPIRLVITGTNINSLVTIRSIEQTEKGGEPEDVYFKLTLKEYRTYKVRQIDLGNTAPTHPNQSFILYTIQKGDTLYEIDQAYDNCTLQDIYTLNPGIQARASRLQIGEKIKLPAAAVQKSVPKRLTTTRPAPAKISSYVTKAKETPISVAKKTGISISKVATVAKTTTKTVTHPTKPVKKGTTVTKKKTTLTPTIGWRTLAQPTKKTPSKPKPKQFVIPSVQKLFSSIWK